MSAYRIYYWFKHSFVSFQIVLLYTWAPDPACCDVNISGPHSFNSDIHWQVSPVL